MIFSLKKNKLFFSKKVVRIKKVIIFAPAKKNSSEVHEKFWNVFRYIEASSVPKIR